MAVAVGDMHRIGGRSVDNLRLKPMELKLNPPGISFLQASSPAEVVRQLRQAFPLATGLHSAAQIMSSTSIEQIRDAGFDVLPNPTKKLPNHFRVVHKDGIVGFNDANLARLSGVLTETSGHLT
jgi:hypothetical protein